MAGAATNVQQLAGETDDWPLVAAASRSRMSSIQKRPFSIETHMLSRGRGLAHQQSRTRSYNAVASPGFNKFARGDTQSRRRSAQPEKLQINGNHLREEMGHTTKHQLIALGGKERNLQKSKHKSQALESKHAFQDTVNIHTPKNEQLIDFWNPVESHLIHNHKENAFSWKTDTLSQLVGLEFTEHKMAAVTEESPYADTEASSQSDCPSQLDSSTSIATEYHGEDLLDFEVD